MTMMQHDAARRPPTAGPADEPRPRRRPWWVLGVGVASVAGWTGWVAAQPLPPSQSTPALKAVQSQIQQESAKLSALTAQAQQWQAQRQQLLQTLQQEDAALAQLTGMRPQPGAAASGGAVNVPRVRAVTRAS